MRVPAAHQVGDRLVDGPDLVLRVAGDTGQVDQERLGLVDVVHPDRADGRGDERAVRAARVRLQHGGDPHRQLERQGVAGVLVQRQRRQRRHDLLRAVRHEVAVVLEERLDLGDVGVLAEHLPGAQEGVVGHALAPVPGAVAEADGPVGDESGDGLGVGCCGHCASSFSRRTALIRSPGRLTSRSNTSTPSARRMGVLNASRSKAWVAARSSARWKSRLV